MIMNNNSNNKNIIIWLNISIFFLVIMVMIGGITRLTDSGLSMVDWKPIAGILPPLNDTQWVDSFNEYKKFPEYQQKNIDMSLSEYKYIFFWEYLHRMMGRFFGFLFLIPFSFFLMFGSLNKKITRHLLLVFMLGGFQGFIGWYMVKSGLVNNPDISHYRLSLHLFIAFVILAYTYKIKLSLVFYNIREINNYIFYNKLSQFIIFLLFVQVIFGAFNAGLKTVHVISTFPFYNGMVLPISKMSLNPFWLNFFENNYGVQFVHRYLAFFIVFIISYFTYKINLKSSRIKLESQYALSLILYQCILGVLTLISNANIVFALIHQLLAVLTILVMIKINHKMKYI